MSIKSPNSKALSQALSVALVVAIILAAFGGYAIGSLVQKPPQTTITNLTGNGLQTVTEVDIVERTGYYTQYVSSNCTTGGGTISLSNPSTKTTYILPSNVTGTFEVTISTTQSEFTTVSTITLHATPPPYPIQIVNGTVTTTSVETCPVYY